MIESRRRVISDQRLVVGELADLGQRAGEPRSCIGLADENRRLPGELPRSRGWFR